jgi:hypothetical protein
MFDSPIGFCEICNGYVLLDQCKRECAEEHGCQAAKCPLASCFAGIDYHALAEPEQGERRFGVTDQN